MQTKHSSYKDFERVSSKVQKEEDWELYFTNFDEVEYTDLMEVLDTQSINYNKMDYLKYKHKGEHYDYN